MRHQKIALELALEKATLEKEAYRRPNSRRNRRSRRRKYYRSTRHPQPLKPTPQHQRQQPTQRVATGIGRRRQKRQISRRRLLFLVLSLILSLFVLKSLVSFLYTSVQSVASQYFQDSRPAITVLPSISPVDALVHAIISQESTENFESVNPHSQALGLAQIMPANLSDWSKEALGYRLTVDEFLKDPATQRQIISYKLNEYWQDALIKSNGDEERAVLKVASHWYSGNPNLYNSTETQWYKGEDGKLYRYPSIAEYSNSVLGRYKKYMNWAWEIRNSV